MYCVTAHYLTEPDDAPAVAEALVELARATRTEEGNVAYDVARSLEDEGHFVIVEAYRTEADFTAHRESPHFAEIGVARILPLLRERRVVAGEARAL
ncbi:putative quinol monooxygenase [Mobilicoccus sp.]|uniref:putative quinol monooxygenase n=1 Tax=Mobilicoccus sp. TaxID=2034349 RepID=UPI0028985A82|nr:putative quinol monooxygenase [Mobilicoccus sp.]